MHLIFGKKNRDKSLSTQATWYFSGRVASYLIVFLIPVILVRIFSKNEYGNYAQFLLIYNFFLITLQFGFRQSLFFFLPKYNQYKKYFITNTYLFFLFVGVLFLLLFSIFKENIALFFNSSDLSSILTLCGLHTFFMLISCPFEPTLVIESKAEIAAFVTFLSEVLRGICVITFVLIFKTLLGAIIGLLCYSFLRFLSYTLFIYKYFGFKIDKTSINHLREQIKYAAPVGSSTIIGTIGKRIDKIILAAFFTPEIFAVYTIGNFKIRFIDMFFSSVGEVALPKAVDLLKSNKVGEFLELWKKILIRLSFVGLGAFFFLQVVAYDLVTLIFTDKYESSVPIFRIIALVILAQMLEYGIILRALGHTKDIFKSNLLAFIFSIPLAYISIKYFGLIGAAISAISVYYINAISQLFFSVKRLEKRVSEIFPISSLFKIGSICIILAAVLINVQNCLHFRVLRIVISGVIYWLAYLYICYKTEVYNVLNERLFKKLLNRFNFVKT